MKRTMITGADGHLGRAIATWLLQNSDRQLQLWVRAANAAERQAKRERLQDLLQTERCDLAFGDLVNPHPFVEVDPDNIDTIVHAAAVIDFNVARDLAQQVNVDGSRRLLEFASRCSQLERCAFLSTLYTAGLRDGPVSEVVHAGNADFANHYEWSKWQAERLITDEFDSLPWQIMRVATVIAEDEDGRVGQQNVVHNTMRLMYYGLLSIVPGAAQTRIYLTTTEFCALACSKLLLDGPRHHVYHVSDSGNDAIDLGSLLDLVYQCFNEDTRFQKLRILKPLLCDQNAFDTLLSGASAQSDIIRQALDSVAPFAPQLFSDKHISTDNLTAVLPELVVPNAADILPRVSRNLIATRWGAEDDRR